MAVFIGHADARPARRRLRSFPAQLAHRRRGKGNALEGEDAVRHHTFKLAGFNLDAIGSLAVRAREGCGDDSREQAQGGEVSEGHVNDLREARESLSELNRFWKTI